MSVIAKLSIQSVSAFGFGQLVTLNCIASNDMMADYAGSEEDKLFTKASPWGEVKVAQPAGFSLGVAPTLGQGATFYAMVLGEDEVDEENAFRGAVAVVEATCHSRTEFGGDSVQVEFFDRYTKTERTKGIERLNWRMSIDNPPASDQIRPTRNYVVAFYPADLFTRDQAIAAAHHGIIPEGMAA